MNLKQLWLDNKTELIKRLKSFAWRAGCAAGVAGVSWASNNLGLLEVPLWLQSFLALGLGEVTKWLNNNTEIFGSKSS